MRRLFLLAALAALAGCDSLAEKTYPPAGDYPDATVGDLLAGVEGAGGLDPGRYNVTAHVVEAYPCPPETDCPTPGFVVLAPSLAPDPIGLAVTLGVEAPLQFRKRDRYRFSVEVTDAGGPTRALRLLGYSRV